MELTNKQEIKVFLTEKMTEKISELVKRYYIELSGDEEAKETLEANDFINSMLQGTPMSSKNQSFIERNAGLFKQIRDYSVDIQLLSK